MKSSIDRKYPVNVYVPRAEPDGYDTLDLRHIAQGSGIVGLPMDDSVLIYFEGNLYNASNIVTYADRCFHAADRLTWKGRGYPTIAQAVVLPEHLDYIGIFNGRQVILDTVHSASARETLRKWLDDPADLDRELRVSI